MSTKKAQVKVYIRTRPTASSLDGLKVDEDGCSVHVKLPKEGGQILGPNNAQDSYAFRFNGVLQNTTQEQMYITAAHEVVESCLAGYSGCILAYGQTAAGKTFTMAGDLHNYVHRGMIPRAIHHVFSEIDMRVDKLYKVHVSYLEIYNEQLYDLLAENPGDSNSMAVQEDPTRGAYVRGLTQVEVKSEEEALAQYFVGEQGRSTSRHVLNSNSSRSHCVFTVHLEIRNSDAASERAVLAKLNLVDLAGSERTKKTNATGQTLREAQCINKSLSFLEQTVTALARKEAHIPFRQSRLTSVLRDALGGNCKTVMVGNIWGEPQHLEETISTLRFASRVRTLTTELSLAESSDPLLLLKRYERQIKELKQELAMRDALSGKARVNYDDLSDIEIREMNQLAKHFLQGEAEVEQLPTESVKRIKECYKQMRSVFSAAGAEMQLQMHSAEARAEKNGANAGVPGSVPGTPGQERVGEVAEGEKGFQVGTAPYDARPSSMSVVGGVNSPGRGGPPSLGGSKIPQSVSGGLLLPDDFNRDASPGAVDDLASEARGGPDRNAAFTYFKHEVPAGCTASAIVKERTAHHKELVLSIRELGATVNAAKSRIDELNNALGFKKAESPAQQNGSGMVMSGPLVDAEQNNLLQELKAAKMQYRSAFDSLREQRSAMDALSLSLAEAKRELLMEFDKWLPTAGSALSKLPGSKKTDEDELDAAEAFDRMQIAALSAAEPDSAAYYAARKQTSTVRLSNTFKGVKAAASNARKKEYEQLINSGMKAC